jgi:DNA-binding transcriptional ArsR family regulator
MVKEMAGCMGPPVRRFAIAAQTQAHRNRKQGGTGFNQPPARDGAGIPQQKPIPKSPKKFPLQTSALGLILNHMVKCSSRMLDRTFAALADPTRRRILAHLSHGEHCVTDLAKPYSMSLPAVSKHLRVLEKAGLIQRRRNGRVHRLQLEAAPMQQASQWIEEYRRFWEKSLDRLDEYLKKLQSKGNKHDHEK